MKLFRFGNSGDEKPGMIINGKHYDVSDYFTDYDERFFESGGLTKLEELLKNKDLPEVIVERFGTPVNRPSKIVCIGLNYSDHAKEIGVPIPTEPVIFLKATSALNGPNDDIVIPKDSVKTDWEVELAIVIGKKTSYATEETAMDFVAGYCLHNDVSEREFQLERGGTWDKGKGCDSFAPLGPYLITKNEIEDVHALHLWLTVNGKTMQDGTTSNLIFNIPHIISYTSRFMTLFPGDIISTGTPAGVGHGMTPPVYLKPGDIVESGIDGLGQAKQQVIALKI